MADHVDSKSLIPFKPRSTGYQLPGKEKDESERMIDEVDPELQPEEQRYVHHYLAYAETLLKNAANRALKAESGVEKKDLTPIRGTDVAEMPNAKEKHKEDAA